MIGLINMKYSDLVYCGTLMFKCSKFQSDMCIRDSSPRWISKYSEIHVYSVSWVKVSSDLKWDEDMM